MANQIWAAWLFFLSSVGNTVVAIGQTMPHTTAASVLTGIGAITSGFAVYSLVEIRGVRRG